MYFAILPAAVEWEVATMPPDVSFGVPSEVSVQTIHAVFIFIGVHELPSVGYIDGIEWEDGVLNVIHMEEGRILPSGLYEYVIRDHLVNTRSGFSADAPGVAKFSTDYF